MQPVAPKCDPNAQTGLVAGVGREMRAPGGYPEERRRKALDLHDLVISRGGGEAGEACSRAEDLEELVVQAVEGGKPIRARDGDVDEEGEGAVDVPRGKGIVGRTRRSDGETAEVVVEGVVGVQTEEVGDGGGVDEAVGTRVEGEEEGVEGGV